MQLIISGEIDGSHPGHSMRKKFTESAGRVQSQVNNIITNQNYGSVVSEIFICPIIVKITKEYEAAGWHMERKLWKRKSRTMDFRLKIDYESFLSSSDSDRDMLILKNLIDSVRILAIRAKGEFHVDQFEAYLFEHFGTNYEDLR